MARVEKTSFDTYNEASVLVQAVRPVVFTIETDVILSQFSPAGPSLGHPKKDQIRNKGIEYRNNADRAEVESDFNLLKRCLGMENIHTKLRETTLTTIALSVIAMNVDNIHRNRVSSFFGELKNRRKNRLVLLNFSPFQISPIVQKALSILTTYLKNCPIHHLKNTLSYFKRYYHGVQKFKKIVNNPHYNIKTL